MTDIAQAREKASSLAGGLGEMKAGQLSIEDALRKAVTEAYGESQDIIGGLDEARGTYLSSPSVAREKYGTPGSESYVRNPLAQERLVSQYTQAKSIPMLALSSILGQRFGRYEDLIGTGTRAYQAQTQRQQSAYDQARQQYADLLGEQQITQAQEQRDWERPFLERQYEYELGKPYYKEAGGAGGGGIDPLTNLLEIMMGGIGGNEPTGTGEWEIYNPSARIVDSGQSARVTGGGQSARITGGSSPSFDDSYLY